MHERTVLRSLTSVSSWVRLASRPSTAPPFFLQRSLLRAASQSFYSPLSSSSRTTEEYDIDRAAKQDSAAVKEELTDYDRKVAADREKQVRSPWMREGSDRPPVHSGRRASAMTKGKLLTTPSRLLKLVLPLTTRDFNEDRKTVEPLALLVHPQQPLSYLERLIQSELPMLESDGVKRPPHVNFRAVDAMAEDSIDPEKYSEESRSLELRKGPGEGGVESYSGAGRERADSNDDDSTENFVRWSKSTEIGDFIRDAARGREFGVEIEGAPNEVRVGVPSFHDRTYYLRMRLRKKAQQISTMADLKKECDQLAHRGAQRMAILGFGGMAGWGVVVTVSVVGEVYRVLWPPIPEAELANVGFQWLTFCTDLGWDVMEPVTYLVGLAGLLGGYAWFLFNRREASYQSAMNLTVSRRQNALYTQRGFNLQRWHQLIDEANIIRREIINIASEYDVEWDEAADAKDKKVIKALKDERAKQKRGKSKDSKDDEGDEEED